jgi:hypothetical protein
MFRALPRFGEIAVSSLGEGIGIAMRKLTCHRIITSLFGFIGFERALASIGISAEMITGAMSHKNLENVRVALIW